MVWVRLDVDNPVASKNRVGRWLNLARIFLPVPVPLFLIHVYETKQLLSKYDIPRIWFFRGFTCPDKFDEPFGAHVTSPETARKDIETVKKKLGEFRYFTRHGFSKHKSGRIWTKKEIESVEERYDLKDLSDLPHIDVCRAEIVDCMSIDHILFHPCYIYTHKEKVRKILDMIKERDDSPYPSRLSVLTEEGF